MGDSTCVDVLRFREYTYVYVFEYVYVFSHQKVVFKNVTEICSDELVTEVKEDIPSLREV